MLRYYYQVVQVQGSRTTTFNSTDEFIRVVHPGIGTIHSIMLHLHQIFVKLESSEMISGRKLFQYVDVMS